jgi:hypothetical protein
MKRLFGKMLLIGRLTAGRFERALVSVQVVLLRIKKIKMDTDSRLPSYIHTSSVVFG